MLQQKIPLTHRVIILDLRTKPRRSKTISFNSKKSLEKLRILFEATAEGA